MSVYAAVQSELERLGEAAVGSVEGQAALSLAAVLDDRAGIQNGGSASTAKELRATMDVLRDRFKAQQSTRLSVLRGTA